MERKSIQQFPTAARDAYNRAAKSSASLDADSSIELLKDVVKRYPNMVQGRERLREIEKRKLFTQGFLSKLFARLTGLFKIPLIRGMIAKDPEKAMAMCEDVLAKCLDNPSALTALADAAQASGAPFIEVEALLLLNEMHPGKESYTRKLAYALQHDNRAREAVKLFQEISSRHPGNIAIQGELRAAVALASIERGKWEQEGSSQQKAADAGDAVAQQLIDGTIHDANQARTLIAKFLKDLEKNDSTDIRKKLAEAYMVAGNYAEAIEEYQKVAEKIGALDPFIDKAIEKAYCAQLNQAIEELRKNPQAYDNPEQQIVNLEAQKYQYQISRGCDRVKAYPNDALLHYDLAVLYFNGNDYENALPEFQQAVKSPQERTNCLVYLGRCFASKGQYDIAQEQFTIALKDMLHMDKQKLAALYYLGNAYENGGNQDKAIACYKEIYQNQSNFLDVKERIDKFYAAQKQ